MLGFLSGVEAMYAYDRITAYFKKRKETKEIYIYGVKQSRSILILDKKLREQTGELNWLQKKSSAQAIKLVRVAVNTKAFEHILEGITKKYWMGKELDVEFKVI